MICTSPVWLYDKNKKCFQLVACKKCIACKINKTSEWTMRCGVEQPYWKNSKFITLTLDDEHVGDNSLDKKELSTFYKALRQDLGDEKIKHFSCGEYGDKFSRKHYHAIVFGIGDDVRYRELIYKNWKKCDRDYFFGRKWYKSYAPVTHDDIQYVCGYVQKKLYGLKAEEEYEGRTPPFQLCSQNIGERYFIDNIKEIIKEKSILYYGKRVPIPETWRRKYDIKFDFFDEQKQEIYEKVEKINKRFGIDLNEMLMQSWSSGSGIISLKGILSNYEGDKREALSLFLQAQKEAYERKIQ